MRIVARRLLGALLVALTCSAACSPGSQTADTPSPAAGPVVGGPAAPVVETAEEAPPPRSVVLVTLDGVRWEDAVGPEAADAMPRTAAIAGEHGLALGGRSSGCGVVRLRGNANLSLPGYLEIFTGHPTRCASNECGRAEVPTILDVASSAFAGRAASVASWPGIERAATSGPAQASVDAGARLRGADRADAETAAIALARLRDERPRFFHVGLGDMDEDAHRGDRDAYRRSLRAADDVIASIWALTGPKSGASVVVTTDHGRGADFRGHGPYMPESGRVWIIAFGAGVSGRGAPCLERDVTLVDVAPTIRALLDLPADTTAGAGRAIDAVVGGG